MVDGGGGSTILHQLKHARYDWMDMRHIFVTHKHIDHLMGIIWMVRMICQFMNHGEYKGAYIYSHKEVLDLIRDMAGKLLLRKETRFIDDRLNLIEVRDGETMNIIGHDVTFFDIQSTKAKQYGLDTGVSKTRLDHSIDDIVPE
jgi:ribonuclease Z